MSTTKNPSAIPTDGGQPLTQNAFANLWSAVAEVAPATGDTAFDNSRTSPAPANENIAAAAPATPPPRSSETPAKNRGRVDIIREKSGRGGKTVTVARGFTGIGLPEKETLAKKMRAACGIGGTVKDGRIEIQGDKREQVARILAEAGFRPVFAGG